MTTVPRALSFSAIDTFRSCALKWAYKYPLKLTTPPSGSAELGSAVHAQLEAWLDDELAPDDSKAGKLAQVVLPHFPAPGQCKSEAKVTMDILPGVPFVGYVDAHWYEDKTLVVADLKTTSDWRYAKTAEQLETDPQLATYVMGLGGETDALVMHVQALTKGTPAARKVGPVRMTAETVRKNWTAMQSDAKTIQDHLALVTPQVVEALDVLAIAPDHKVNLQPCAAYGGCPFRNICPRSDINYQPPRKENVMPTPAQLARRAATQAVQQAAQTLQPQSAQVNAIVPPDATSDYQEPITEANGRIKVSELRPGQWRAYLDDMTISKNGVNSWPNSERALEVARGQLALEEEQDGTNPAPTGDKPKRTRRTKAQMEADRAQADTKVVEDGGPPAEVANPVRPRPPASKPIERTVAATPVSHAVAPDEKPIVEWVKEQQDKVTVQVLAKQPPTLYVSCLPIGQEVSPIEDILAPLEDEVAYEQKVPYYGLVGYGAGPKHVVGKLLVLWHKNKPTKDACMSTLHPYAEEVIAQWQRAGGKVVRGVR